MLLAEARSRLIVEQVDETGRVATEFLAALPHVSVETVRREELSISGSAASAFTTP